MYTSHTRTHFPRFFSLCNFHPMPLKDDLHDFVDNHIREIKYFAYGLGAFGIILIVKDLHLVRTFQHVSHVPIKFLDAHVTLQGHVRQVDAQGCLHVHHEPVFTVPFSKRLQRILPQAEPGLLPVELGGVKISAGGVQWLEQNVLDRHVWFRLLQAVDTKLVCSVHVKKNAIFKMNVNEALIMNGLGRVEPFAPSASADSDIFQQILTRLNAAEHKAKKKKLGIWQVADKHTVSWTSWFSFVGRPFKWVGRTLKERLWKK